ncbi:MAG: hypothetical protein IKM61_04925 [Eubacteriaceae bacterium]|nr:hypothetical protein [Eubacteriaceae bacterium]
MMMLCFAKLFILVPPTSPAAVAVHCHAKWLRHFAAKAPLSLRRRAAQAAAGSLHPKAEPSGTDAEHRLRRDVPLTV